MGLTWKGENTTIRDIEESKTGVDHMVLQGTVGEVFSFSVGGNSMVYSSRAKVSTVSDRMTSLLV